MNNTQIFARMSALGTQFLAYQMNYESQVENAMILPVPIQQPAREDRLRFINLQDYENFFEDLACGFPYNPPSFNLACSDAGYALRKHALPVFKVGNYVASFVPRISDFARLDDRFRLPENLWAKIPEYREYSFAVFQLSAGGLRPHPMAFEFESRMDSIFFPTLHIHDGEVHEMEEFDHVLYLQHAGFDSRVYGYRNFNVRDQSTGWIRSKEVASHFCDVGRSQEMVVSNLLMHRLFVRGVLPNQDTVIKIIGDPMMPTLNLRFLATYTPWMLIAVGVMWFCARRTRLQTSKLVARGNAENDPGPGTPFV